MSKKEFTVGGTAIVVTPSVMPMLGFKLYEQVTVKSVHAGTCGCGGDKVEFEERPGALLCTKAFMPSIDVINVSRDLKMTAEDFEV